MPAVSAVENIYGIELLLFIKSIRIFKIGVEICLKYYLRNVKQNIPHDKTVKLNYRDIRGGEAISENEVIQEMMHSRTLLTPQASTVLCTACGVRVDQCPVSALSMNKDIPEVEDETCIRCFFCQEICPVKTIALR